MKRLALVLSLCVSASMLASACKKAPPKPRTSQAAPATPAASPERAPLARARIDALLAEWLAAQNAGRFEAYEPLYASRFDGVRRTRKRTVHFDRAGWMTDRRRMFQRPMQVAIEDVNVRATSRTAEVDFVQRWASGRFHDVGRKRLLVIEENGALRIAIEEMLETRTPAPIEAGLTSPAWFVLSAAIDTYLVIGDVDGSLAEGPARLVAESPHVAVRAFRGGVPPALASLVGTHVTIGACEAQVVDVAIAAVVEPHFGTEQEWEEEHATTEQRATDVFGLTREHSIVAKLDRRCEGRLATRAGTPIVIPPGETPTEAERDTLLDRFVALDVGRTAKAAIEESLAAMSDDEEAPDEGAWRSPVHVTEFVVGEQRYLLFAIAIGDACSSRYDGAFVFRVDGDALVPLTDTGLYGTPMLVDVGGDGTPELVIEELEGTRVLYHLGTTLERVTSLPVAYLDCPC